MEVWGRYSSVAKTLAKITQWGVELEEFEHHPDYKFETMKEFNISWRDWDEIVASVQACRKKVRE